MIGLDFYDFISDAHKTDDRLNHLMNVFLKFFGGVLVRLALKYNLHCISNLFFSQKKVQ